MKSTADFASRNVCFDNWEKPLQRLHDNNKRLFIDKGPFDVRLIRAGRPSDAILRPDSLIELEEHLLKSSCDDFRILSFCQEYSLSPFMCSIEAMLTVLRSWQVSSMFVDVLLRFGDQPQTFQESSGSRQLYQAMDASFELCYQFMYVERNGRRPPRDPWSIRQTGVSHKFSSGRGCSEVIILHPTNEAIVQTHLENMAESTHRADLTSHPLNIHLAILSTYLANWQGHIESLAEDLEHIRRHVDVVDISDWDACNTIDPECLQDLRHIEDKIVCKASRCLRSTDTLVQTLMTINEGLALKIPALEESSYTVRQELKIIKYHLESHIDAAEILAQRVQATLGLLTNLLDIGTQANSREISTRILRLTQESVDDNATVKVITVFSLIYLPASFMASFLGMNLFDFKGENGALQASPQFWIFIVTTIPLTMLTVGAWYLYKTRYNKNKKARSDAETV